MALILYSIDMVFSMPYTLKSGGGASVLVAFFLFFLRFYDSRIGVYLIVQIHFISIFLSSPIGTIYIYLWCWMKYHSYRL